MLVYNSATGVSQDAKPYKNLTTTTESYSVYLIASCAEIPLSTCHLNFTPGIYNITKRRVVL